MQPIVPFLTIPESGDPYLSGNRCGACGEVFIGDRIACANCGSRTELSMVKLANRGELYTYTIVHRSFPGIATPYVSAVVDLEGGGTLKGNLINIDPDPNVIEMGMPVEVVFGDAGVEGAKGTSYLAYFFQPASGEA